MDGIQRQGSASKSASWANWVMWGALFCVPLLLVLTYQHLRFVGLNNPDALDFAQLGRNLSFGRGFVTFILRPLALTHGSNPLRQPEMTHGPLFPFVLALAFGAAGAKDTVASVVSMLFYVLTVPLVFLMGRRLFTPLVGGIAALVFALSPLNLDYAISGLHISFTIFLSTCLFLTLTGLMEKTNANTNPNAPPVPRGRLALAGLLAGALYLTDPIFFWILPAIVGTVLWMQKRERTSWALWFGLPLALLILPWMARNAMTSGNPVFGLRGAEVWMNTQVYPASTGYRLLPGDMVADGGLFSALLLKMLTGINQILRSLPQMSGNWILAFFLPSLFFRFTDRTAESVRRTALFCLLSLCAAMLLFTVQMPLLFCLMPIVLIFSVAYLVHLAQQAHLNRRALHFAAGLIALATLYPLFSEMALSDKPQPHRLAASARLLARQSRPADACVSDQPWITAWYADRPSLWIPARDDQMSEARRLVSGSRWLFLTEQTRTYSGSWQYVYDAFYNWNAGYKSAVSVGGAAPPNIVIEGTGQPLIEALSGFTSVNPDPDMSPTVVVARAVSPRSWKAQSDVSRTRIASGKTHPADETTEGAR